MKDTKKTKTRMICHVVHSNERSENEDSQEKNESIFKESRPKRKRTIITHRCGSVHIPEILLRMDIQKRKELRIIQRPT